MHRVVTMVALVCMALCPRTMAAELPAAEDAGHVKRGIDFASQGHYDEAAQQFYDAIKSNPSDAEAHFQMGMLNYYVKNNKEAAITELKSAMAINSKDPDMSYNLGFILAKEGRYAQMWTLQKVEATPVVL